MAQDNSVPVQQNERNTKGVQQPKPKDSGSKQLLRPSQKVAALLILLGAETATEVLKHITDPNILEQITLDIANLNKVPDDELTVLLEEFRTVFKASNLIATGGTEYARKLLANAYGADEATEMMDKLGSMINTNPFYFLNDVDPGQFATTFSGENPQLLALIMAYLKPALSAQILAALPNKVQKQVSMKIAEMNTTNPEILSEIEDVVEKKFSTFVVHDFSKAGGVEYLASIMNHCDRFTEKNIMEFLEAKDSILAQSVRDLMFVFEDIIILDDRAIQRVLREVDSRELALSMKGTKEEIREKIFRNMSERAQAMLQEDIEYLGPVRAREVQDAQSKIVATIRALELSGEITISRGNAEDELIE